MKLFLFAALIAAVLLRPPCAISQENPPPHHPAPHNPAQAAVDHGEGHEDAPMPNEIWWKWANFAILAAGIGYLIQKNAVPYFKARSEQIASGIAEATRTREEAEARAASIEQRVGNLAAEVEQIRIQSREEMAREGDRMRAETEARVSKINAQAQAEIASAVKHATLELKAESAKIALELAETQLRDRMSPEVQDQLAGSFIADLRRNAEKN